MIFTDPPYGMSYGGGRAEGDHAIDKKTGGVKEKSHGMILNDDLRGDELVNLVRDAIASSTASMKAGGGFMSASHGELIQSSRHLWRPSDSK